MPAFHIQNVLSGGEISPLLRARADQPHYNTGAREMLNFVPMPQGGVARRPGTVFLGQAHSDRARLLPFIFSATQGRILEFGNKTMRVWLADGTLVARNGEPLVVETPFADDALLELRYAQSADVIFFAHPGYAPCKLSRYADDNWRFESLTFQPDITAPEAPTLSVHGETDVKGSADYKYVVTAISKETGRESNPSSVATINAKPLSSGYYIHLSWPSVVGAAEYRVYKFKGGVFGFIGRVPGSDVEPTQENLDTLNSFKSSVDRWNATLSSLDTQRTAKLGQIAANESAYENCVQNNEGNCGRYTETINGLRAEVSSLDLQISNATAQRNTFQAEYNKLANSIYGANQFDDKNIGADGEDTPPDHKNPFDGEGKYPSLVFMHQQRLGFASSTERPITVWLSRTGDFESMASSVPPKDDDAIEVTLASPQANRIVWLMPDRTSLTMGTEGSEWTLAPSEGVVLTPKNCTFQLQTSNGGERIHPLSVGGAVFYVQRGSTAVREFAYNYSADKYLGQDLTILARHIFRDVEIRAWAYQQEPYSVIWCALSDGTLAGLTYMREQDVIGWHRHDTDGTVLDVAVIPGTPDDQLWLLIRRMVEGEERLYVERLAPFFDDNNLGSAVYLDASLSYQGPPVSEFSGLRHLNGKECKAFADGGTIDPVTVHDGICVLDEAAASVIIGLPYVSRLVPNLPEVQTQEGSSLMHNRQVQQTRVRVYRSMTFQAGLQDTGRMYPITDRQVTDSAFSIVPFYSEGTDLVLDLAGAWSDGNALILEVDTPTPLTILALLTVLQFSPFAGKP